VLNSFALPQSCAARNWSGRALAPIQPAESLTPPLSHHCVAILGVEMVCLNVVSWHTLEIWIGPSARCLLSERGQVASFTAWRRAGSLILSGFWCMLAILGGIQDGAVTPGFAFRPAWGS
jgi:hypothetical protein